MNHDYKDIRSRIAEEPKWFDEHAVPRYCDFAPGEAANIYARQCCLLLIECQGCETEFQVCLSTPHSWLGGVDLAEQIRKDVIHYGDPPNVGCCPAGPTMNSVPVKVLEFWERDALSWERAPYLEIGLDHERGEISS